jgi:hypothetical protein
MVRHDRIDGIAEQDTGRSLILCAMTPAIAPCMIVSITHDHIATRDRQECGTWRSFE